MGIKLFPIGNIASKVSTGSIDGVDYSMFEPNEGCKSYPVHTTLLTTYQDQTILSRKKAEPYLALTYSYNNILESEYKQLEHFVDSVDDALTSFFTVDWSRGKIPSAVASAAGNWTISLDDTRYYSATSNKKSNKMLVWDGSSWKMGTVSSLTRNTSVVITIQGYSRGSLRYSLISPSDVTVYPVYEVRLSANSLANFEKSDFWDDNTSDRGYLRTGLLSFISKYKVK